MDQFIFASLSHTHYWYEVGMLKVPAIYIIRSCQSIPILYVVCMQISEEIIYQVQKSKWQEGYRISRMKGRAGGIPQNKNG